MPPIAEPPLPPGSRSRIRRRVTEIRSSSRCRRRKARWAQTTSYRCYPDRGPCARRAWARRRGKRRAYASPLLGKSRIAPAHIRVRCATATKNRSYPFTFAVSSADTWEFGTRSVGGDTSGTWAETGHRPRLEYSRRGGRRAPARRVLGRQRLQRRGFDDERRRGNQRATFQITGVIVVPGIELPLPIARAHHATVRTRTARLRALLGDERRATEAQRRLAEQPTSVGIPVNVTQARDADRPIPQRPIFARKPAFAHDNVLRSCGWGAADRIRSSSISAKRSVAARRSGILRLRDYNRLLRRDDRRHPRQTSWLADRARDSARPTFSSKSEISSCEPCSPR